jgi:serine/threonine protein phosphatase PrpC
MRESFGVSDQGCVRKNNEDYLLVARDLGLYLVADGMGGAQAGEHASQLAADTVERSIREAAAPSAEALTKAFEEANRQVLQAASADASLDGMGTTLVAALEAGENLLIASVGDSRVYVLEAGQLLALTEDQTWVNEVGRKLGITEVALQTHPMRHVLTMAIGVSSDLRVHSYQLKPQPGTQVLLCSDGLHGVIGEEQIAAALSAKGTAESKCKKLVEAARNAGGPDNITALLLVA